MGEKILCLLFFSLVGLTTGSFDYSGRATMKDVYAFFNTSQRIFLHTRSYSRLMKGRDPWCVYNDKVFLNSTNLEVTQVYFNSDGSTNYVVHFALSEAKLPDEAPLMEATGPRGKKRNYRFQYYDDERKCAVITFSDNACSMKCELHIWKAEAMKGPSENCKREYQYLCRKRETYTVFNKTCPMH